MANHSIFLVFCLASILFSIDCASTPVKNVLKSETPDTKVSTESVPSHSTEIPHTSTNSTPTNGTTTSKPPPPPPPPTNGTTTSTQKPTTVTSTEKPTSSTSKPTDAPTTPSPPPTTTAAPSKHDRSFDLPSFIGGVILSLGLAAIGYVVYKFYRTRTDPNYRSL